MVSCRRIGLFDRFGYINFLLVNTESEGMSIENAKDDIAAEEQIDTQSNVVESDNFKACQDENEEVGIEIGLGKDEKEDFTAHEGDEGQQQDVSMKQEMKQKKKVYCAT